MSVVDNSIAVTLAFLVASVGLQAPAAPLPGFIPIMCMTIAQRQFLTREPDAGTVFVWVGKALGPKPGWLAGWALLAATMIALANLANITGTYFFLLIGADAAAGTEWRRSRSAAHGWPCRSPSACAASPSPHACRSRCSPSASARSRSSPWSPSSRSRRAPPAPSP